MDGFRENQFVVMLGGLHIEMAALKMLGKWLNGSGWTEVMCNAGVATQGVADSFLSASHVTRTRRAHQITAASLYILMKKAYDEFCIEENKDDKSRISFDDWKKAMQTKSPQFLYWESVLKLELTCLQLVRAFREASFPLYIRVIRQILPWMFALDHPNYSRWLSVHYRDMLVYRQKIQMCTSISCKVVLPFTRLQESFHQSHWTMHMSK